MVLISKRIEKEKKMQIQVNKISVVIQGEIAYIYLKTDLPYQYTHLSDGQLNLNFNIATDEYENYIRNNFKNIEVTVTNTDDEYKRYSFNI